MTIVMQAHLSNKAVVGVQISMDHIHGMQIGLDEENNIACTDKLRWS